MLLPHFFVVQEGLEPSQAEPESEVLPLHHWTIFVFDVAKVLLFPENAILLIKKIYSFSQKQLLSLFCKCHYKPTGNYHLFSCGNADCILA